MNRAIVVLLIHRAILVLFVAILHRALHRAIVVLIAIAIATAIAIAGAVDRPYPLSDQTRAGIRLREAIVTSAELMRHYLQDRDWIVVGAAGR